MKFFPQSHPKKFFGAKFVRECERIIINLAQTFYEN